MLAEMAGETDDLADQLDGLDHAPVGKIQPQFLHARIVRPAVGTAPDLAGKGGSDIGIEPHHLADFADRRAGAEMDHRGAEAGPVASVFLIDILDHFFAPLMFEVDIDIRGFAPVFGDEALRHHGDGFRADIGDAERIADDGIGCRTAPLAQDMPAAGKADDVVNGQEIGGELELGDQPQFLSRQLLRMFRNTGGITHLQTLEGQPLQPVLRVLPVGDLVRIFIRQLGKVKTAAGRDLDRPPEGRRMVAVETGHVSSRFQPPLAIGQRADTDLVDGAAFAQAGQHIGKPPSSGMVHQDITDRNHRRCQRMGSFRAGTEPGLVGAVIARRGTQENMARHFLAKGTDMILSRLRKCIPCMVSLGQCDEEQAFGELHDVLKFQMAVALFRSPLAEGEQLAEPFIGCPVGRQGDEIDRTVHKHQACADDQPRQFQDLRHGQGRDPVYLLPGRGIDLRVGAYRHAFLVRRAPDLLQRRIGPDNPCKRIPVGDGNRLKSEFGSPRHQFLRVGRPAQESEVGGNGQLRMTGNVPVQAVRQDVGGHRAASTFLPGSSSIKSGMTAGRRGRL